ncbi:hypothetical protein KIN20_036136 [Parelaphostrongylus tenuis]|uniref:Uncharacterized protein n=1 Tax=Parelaphostrongylus tenuis TaxID=148309 RepID=A0AAD5RC84_PARTN|nr:hypothetical protein KIN20_036136 [Parelaphostrongylus tenuis]
MDAKYLANESKDARFQPTSTIEDQRRRGTRQDIENKVGRTHDALQQHSMDESRYQLDSSGYQALYRSHRSNGPISSQKYHKKHVMLSESVERGGLTGLFMHEMEKDGSVAGTRSSHSTINGTTGDTGEEKTNLFPLFL